MRPLPNWGALKIGLRQQTLALPREPVERQAASLSRRASVRTHSIRGRVKHIFCKHRLIVENHV